MISNLVDAVYPYCIYIPVVSTGTGLYRILHKEETAPDNLSDRNIAPVENMGKVAISIIPFLGNLIVIIINVAEWLLPSEDLEKVKLQEENGILNLEVTKLKNSNAKMEEEIGILLKEVAYLNKDKARDTEEKDLLIDDAQFLIANPNRDEIEKILTALSKEKDALEEHIKVEKGIDLLGVAGVILTSTKEEERLKKIIDLIEEMKVYLGKV